MSAIVRCVGMEMIGIGVAWARSWPSCGWKSPDGTASNFCPKCGGEVELIPTDGAL
jgi:hypothetical protein